MYIAQYHLPQIFPAASHRDLYMTPPVHHLPLTHAPSLLLSSSLLGLPGRFLYSLAPPFSTSLLLSGAPCPVLVAYGCRLLSFRLRPAPALLPPISTPCPLRGPPFVCSPPVFASRRSSSSSVRTASCQSVPSIIITLCDVCTPPTVNTPCGGVGVASVCTDRSGRAIAFGQQCRHSRRQRASLGDTLLTGGARDREMRATE